MKFMMIEIRAKSSKRWMRKLLTCKTKNPPNHRRTKTTARMRNMYDLLSANERPRLGAKTI
jgi:hypothetical protein